MKAISRILLAGIFTIPFSTKAQVFWTETFDAVACPSGCVMPYGGINGMWTEVATGAVGAERNTYYVSCAESGEPAGACGAGCGSVSDNSLHVGTTLIGDAGAAYFSGGFGLDATTNIRAESPVINCSGKSGITLAFNYIENGQTTLDNAQLWYYNGSTWALLFDIAKTTLCGGGQGKWTPYSIVLPATADGNPNVKIGFAWTNNNDAVGTDPSFAVDDITLSTVASGPTAAFTYAPTTICLGQTVTFTNTSTGAGPLVSSWDFDDGTTSLLSSPTHLYLAPGCYNVTLIVVDGGGFSDTETQVVCVLQDDPMVTTNDSILCNTSFGMFLNSNDATGGAWTGTFVSDSGGGNGFFSSAGDSSGTYLAIYTTNGTCPTSDTVLIYIPEAPSSGFTYSNTGLTFFFNENTTGSGLTYNWTVDGTPFSTSANPNYTFTGAGSYNVCLEVTSDSGCTALDCQTIVITGINEIDKVNQVIIFPNPASNLVDITAPINSVIEIRNMAGQLITGFTTSKSSTQISVNTWPAGIYTMVSNKIGIAKLVVVKE